MEVIIRSVEAESLFLGESSSLGIMLRGFRWEAQSLWIDQLCSGLLLEWMSCRLGIRIFIVCHCPSFHRSEPARS